MFLSARPRFIKLFERRSKNPGQILVLLLGRTLCKSTSRFTSTRPYSSSSRITTSTPFPTNNELFRISSKLKEAIKENEAVVALESAIITHGMPFPQNIEMALRLQNIIREKNAIPATVGVIKGQLVVGLSDQEIEFIGSPSKTTTKTTNSIVKVSRRDLPYVLSQGISGGTTVSGSIIGAAKANIPIFATGGLGGVHRGVEQSFDISADLKELGRNSVTVVSAGIKSILDIGKTLEYLETEGVCVVVMKRKHDLENQKTQDALSSSRLESDHQNNSTPKFPSFFTAESQFTCPYMIQDEVQGAQLIHSALEFGLGSGILIAVPIPKEFEASGVVIEKAIELSLKKAKELGIKGRDITPFLLGEINKLTAGASLEANKHLIENNVQVASAIALELAKLKRYSRNQSSQKLPSATFNNQTIIHSSIISKFNEQHEPSSSLTTKPHEIDIAPLSSSQRIDDGKSFKFNELVYRHFDCGDVRFHLPSRGPPVVIGGSSLDLVLAVQEDKIVQDGRTHQARINTIPGGVARNIAEALAKLGHGPLFISAIGDDLFGQQLLRSCKELDINTEGILISQAPQNNTNHDQHYHHIHNGKNKTNKASSSHFSTAIYSMILTCTGECLFGLGDMSLHSTISPAFVEKHEMAIKAASIVVLDTNISVQTLAKVMSLCVQNSVPVWLEPTEIRKVKKVLELPSQCWPCIQFMSPNLRELISLTEEKNFDDDIVSQADIVIESLNVNSYISKCFDKFSGLLLILLTKGKDGFSVFYRGNKNQGEDSGIFANAQHHFVQKDFPSPTFDSTEIIKSVSGSGDCLNAGFIAGLLEDQSLQECALNGTACAKKALLSIYNVPASLTSPK